MTTQMNVTIGKTHINIDVTGCFRCGTPWSNGWYHLKSVRAVIDNIHKLLPVHVCADCATEEERKGTQVILPHSGKISTKLF